MTAISTKDGDSAPPKKPYETPRLEVYGDVREVARSVGLFGMLDGFLALRTR